MIASHITGRNHRLYRTILILLLQAGVAMLVFAASIRWPWMCEPLQTALKSAAFIHAVFNQRRNRTATE